MDIHARIKILAEERGWSQYELAQKAGLTHSTVSNLYYRNNTPTLPTLEALCTAFGITMAQFFYEGDGVIELSEDQKRILSLWGSLSEAERNALSNLIEIVLKR